MVVVAAVFADVVAALPVFVILPLLLPCSFPPGFGRSCPLPWLDLGWACIGYLATGSVILPEPSGRSAVAAAVVVVVESLAESWFLAALLVLFGATAHVLF